MTLLMGSVANLHLTICHYKTPPANKTLQILSDSGWQVLAKLHVPLTDSQYMVTNRLDLHMVAQVVEGPDQNPGDLPAAQSVALGM